MRLISATMSLTDTFLAAWKHCLSFRKCTWALRDYPVVIREQKVDADPAFDLSRFELQRYLARVVNWWVLTGGGNTPREAMENLAVQFGKMKADFERDGKPLPCPGIKVPIEFAPTEQVNADPELAHDFINRVLGL